MEKVTSAVLGDSGVLYVSPNVVSIYRAMLPLSTIITPNWFEVEWVPVVVPHAIRLTLFPPGP